MIVNHKPPVTEAGYHGKLQIMKKSYKQLIEEAVQDINKYHKYLYYKYFV